MEQIVDFPVSGEGLQDFRPQQSSSSFSHFLAGVHEVLVKGVFRTFPQNKQSAKVTRHSSARVPQDASSSTLSAHQMAFHDERATWNDEERAQAWCRFEDSCGRYYWNLLTTDHSHWEPPWERRP